MVSLVIRGLDSLQSVPRNTHYAVDNTGATDISTTLNAAMVAADGRPVEIPAGTYLVKDCQIPTANGCHLKPDGDVTIQWDATGDWGGLYFRGENNFGSEVSITAIADHDDYPATNDQRISKITGSFSGWSAGDIALIYSNEKDNPGNFLGEYIEVLDVDPASSAFIYANKKLYHTFDTATFAPKIRRVETVVPIKIEKGITFTPNGDQTASGNRRPAVLLRMPVRPDVSVDFDGVWGSGIEVMGSFLGDVAATYRDIWVDYSISQFGYVVVRSGCCYGTRFTVSGNKSGAICDTVVNGGTYDGSQWFKIGTVLDNVMHNCYAQNCRRSPFRTHGCYRDTYFDCVAENGAMDDEENANFWNAFSITGRDVRMFNCHSNSQAAFLDVDGDYGSGVTDNWLVANCTYMTNRGATTTQAPFLSVKSTDVPNKAISVSGGHGESNQILFNIAKQVKSLRIGGGFVGKSDYAFMEIRADSKILLDDLSLIADANHLNRAILCLTSTDIEIHVGHVRVGRDG